MRDPSRAARLKQVLFVGGPFVLARDGNPPGVPVEYSRAL
jgi:hypothetical protein